MIRALIQRLTAPAPIDWNARLEQTVAERRASRKHQQFIKHRAAAKLGIDRKRGMV